MEALVLDADTYPPELGKTPNVLTFKRMPWTSQSLTNSEFKHF